MFWAKKSAEKGIDLDQAARAIVRVGSSGWGFIARTGTSVVTTVNCLPAAPVLHFPISYEKNPNDYEKILSIPDTGKIASARCTFADLASNLAILNECDASYTKVVIRENGLSIEAPERPHIAGDGGSQEVWILDSLGRWRNVIARSNYGRIHFDSLPFDLDVSMSGLPILNQRGAAIGLLAPASPTVALNEDPEDLEYCGDAHLALVQRLPGSMIDGIWELAFPERE